MKSRRTKNKKVKNAKECVFDDIKFKSQLECKCYQKLLENGFDVKYEPFKLKLFEGFYPKNFTWYQPVKQKSIKKYIFKQIYKKILDITYTPDFFVWFKNCKIFIETKGKPNDSYPLKKKLFLKKLSEFAEKYSNEKYYFFEPHNQQQIDELIAILKNIKNND